MVRLSDKYIFIDRDLCDLCGTCVGVCPENVMRLSRYRLTIEHEGCTRCSKCIWICPVSALQLLPREKPSFIDES